MNTGSYNSEGHLKILYWISTGNDRKRIIKPMTAAHIQMTNNNYSFPDRKIDSIRKGIQPFIANKKRNIS